MIWWIVIPAAIAVALAYAFWDHRKQSRRLVGLFAPLAATYGGTVKAATILALPQLRFEREGRRYSVGAMATAGTRVSGSASRPGFTGPFTFANVDIPLDTGQDLSILRTDRLDRAVIRLINSVSSGPMSTSGDSVFDNAFRIKSNDQAFVHRVLDQALRQRLSPTAARGDPQWYYDPRPYRRLRKNGQRPRRDDRDRHVARKELWCIVNGNDARD
jgi:hypothetical protein